MSVASTRFFVAGQVQADVVSFSEGNDLSMVWEQSYITLTSSIIVVMQCNNQSTEKMSQQTLLSAINYYLKGCTAGCTAGYSCSDTQDDVRCVEFPFSVSDLEK